MVALLCRQLADKDAALFAADKTHNLIVRLQYNVIRAGLRRINLAYSRISLADVATRLGEHTCRHAELFLKVVNQFYRDDQMDVAVEW